MGLRGQVDLAFDSWVWPLLGLVFRPWTTLAYVIAWQPGGLNGKLGRAPDRARSGLDILTWMHRFAAKAVQVQASPRH